MIPPQFAHIEVLDTLPKLLRDNAKRYPHETVLRTKELGRWRTWDWTRYHERTRQWAIGLRALGLRRGDTVAIIGDARPDWVAAAVGAHALGVKTLGLYQDALDDEVAYLLDYCGARVVIAENEEQVDKMLSVAAQASGVERIVYCDARGMRKYDDPRLVAADTLLADAAKVHLAEPALWDTLVDATTGDDIAILCTTSGTTARPKLATYTGGKLIRHVATYCAALGIGPDDEYVSILPMGWIVEQFQAVFQPIVCRNRISFVEDSETTMADLREIAPTFIVLAPRVWEGIAASVRAQMMDASPLKQKVFAWGLDLGLAAVEKGGVSRLAQAVVLRALRDRLGFTRLRFACTGGAPMGPDTFKFFMAMGLPMLQIYGQTELGGVYCMQRPGEVDFDSVGTGLTGDYEIRIDNADAHGVGEVVSRHPYMFEGYFRNEEATRADLRDGWMHTGDAGYFKPSGQLVVIDRMRDLATTSAGDRFSPQFIENKLKFSPYVSEAVLLGDQRPFLAAIVCLRFPIVSKWAEQNRMAFTTYSDLASREEVCGLVGREIERVNGTLPPTQRVRKFVLLYKELDADDGELTRTRKVRRGVIAEKYGEIIEAIYGGAESVRIDTEITFQGGSKQRIRTTMPIATLAQEPAAGRKAS